MFESILIFDDFIIELHGATYDLFLWMSTHCNETDCVKQKYCRYREIKIYEYRTQLGIPKMAI
jgi:hypothetical protein